MSEPTIVASIETRRTTVGVRQPADRVRARGTFYVGMSGTLFLLVLMGFSRTLYLRAFFNVPQIPASVWLHGLALTAWFAGAFLQAGLVAAHRVDLHRRLGWTMVGLGVAALLITAAVTLNFEPRRRALGADIEAGMAGLSAVIWGDLAALVVFAVLFPAAVALRRHPETHKRLMLLSSISLTQPAMSRMARWPVFHGVDSTFASVSGLVLLVVALALYDVFSRKRVHAATLLGGLFLMGTRMLGIFVVATSELGRSFVRGLG